MHMLQSLFYLTTALHVSSVAITHLQEHKTTDTTASGNRYTLLLSVAIVEELEPVSVCGGWRRAGRPTDSQLKSTTRTHCYIHIYIQFTS
jgi:hypothetical protein